MIVRGFFEQVLAQIHTELIREQVLTALAPRIGTTEEGGHMTAPSSGFLTGLDAAIRHPRHGPRGRGRRALAVRRA